ncbi:unnamed protein product, partial [Allacma fusca]
MLLQRLFRLWTSIGETFLRFPHCISIFCNIIHFDTDMYSMSTRYYIMSLPN